MRLLHRALEAYVSPFGGVYLFVYGTSMRGQAKHSLLSPHADFVCKGRIRGLLYNLGPYPGCVETRRDFEWVCGELWLLRSFAALSGLDTYEGCPFVRRPVGVEKQDGSICMAWAYFYRGPLTDAVLIWSGTYDDSKA